MKSVVCWLFHRKWRMRFDCEADPGSWGWTEHWGCLVCARSWEEYHDCYHDPT